MATKLGLLLLSSLIWLLTSVAGAVDTLESDLVDYTESIEIKVPSAEVACGLLANAGDIILQHESTFDEHHLGDNILRLAKLKEILSFKSPEIKYGHAELITDIATDTSGLSLVSWSFYPPKFQDHLPPEDRKGPYVQYGYGGDPTYRFNFAVFRVLPGIIATTTELRELALKNTEFKQRDSVYGYRMLQQSQGNGKSGATKLVKTAVAFSTFMNVCGDFVAWAYEKHITSWWNRIPVARQIIATLYPPESIVTPDDLASSPYTEKVCDIENLKLKYPQGPISTVVLMKAIQESLTSVNPIIQKHATWVRNFLLNRNIINVDGEILQPSFRLTVETN
jgi:hypothetical protein